MSWRMHLAIVDPKKISEIRKLPKDHYLNENGYTCDEDGENSTTEFYQFVANDFGCKEDYCLGVLPIELDELGQPFYLNEDTQELFEYYHPRVIDENVFKNIIIEEMRKAAYELYSETEELGPEHCMALVHRRKELWASEYTTPYKLNANSQEIVGAFSIDYQIWDVVRMYKTIDWKNDAVILFGW